MTLDEAVTMLKKAVKFSEVKNQKIHRSLALYCRRAPCLPKSTDCC